MSKTLVSVIIPAYNHEKYVQETIKSIINQTYQNIELIVIDDGSKDSTWQKILEMKDKCGRRFEKVPRKMPRNYRKQKPRPRRQGKHRPPGRHGRGCFRRAFQQQNQGYRFQLFQNS